MIDATHATKKQRTLFFLITGLYVLFSQPVVAAEKKTDPLLYEDSQIKFQVLLQTPKQISAFYEGRGFSRPAIDRLASACFIALLVHNKSRDVLWLDLTQWQFEGPGATKIDRLSRDYWVNHWDATGLDQASRSTYGWTLMPEQRDLREDEGVGGRVSLPMQKQAFTLIANFNTGATKSGAVKTVRIDSIICKPDTEN